MVFEHKMEPLACVAVLGVLDVWKREYWSIQSDRKNSDVLKNFTVENEWLQVGEVGKT